MICDSITRSEIAGRGTVSHHLCIFFILDLLVELPSFPLAMFPSLVIQQYQHPSKTSQSVSQFFTQTIKNIQNKLR